METRRRSIITSENHDCIFRQSQLIQCFDKTSDLFVHFSKNRDEGFFRIPAFIILLLKFRYPRSMHIIRPEIQKERLVFMTFDKVDALIYKVLGTSPAFYAVFGRPYPVRSSDCRFRVRTFIRRYIFVKTIIFNRRCIVHVAPASHVPFTYVSGGITCTLESTCHGRILVTQKVTLFTLLIAGFII